MLLDIKTNKDQTTTNNMKTMAPLIQSCIYSIATLGHFNSTIEQNRQDHNAVCLDNQYRRLSKDVLPHCEWLFAVAITRGVMTAATNRKLLMKKSTSFTTSSSSLDQNLSFFHDLLKTLEIILQHGLNYIK